MKKTIIFYAVAAGISCSAWAGSYSSDDADYKAYLAYKAQLDAEQDAIIKASMAELEGAVAPTQTEVVDSPAVKKVQPVIYSAVVGGRTDKAEYATYENGSTPKASSPRGGYPAHSMAATPANDGALAYADNCVGSVVASKYVISAGHCGDQTGKMVNIKAPDGTTKTLRVTATIHHPLYDSLSARVYDVAIWQLDGKGDATKYISNSTPAVGALFDGLSMKGGTFRSYRVRATGPADPRFSPDGYEGLYSPTDAQTTGYSVPGDSGGACVGSDGLLWGVVQGSAGQGDGTFIQSCQSLTNPNTTQWLLETINAWSAPSFVKGDSSITIQIQNLHPTAEFLNPIADGVVIEGNTCTAAIQPLGKCEIVVRGTGKVALSPTEEIKVNEILPPNPDGNGGNGGNGGEGGGGGSTSPIMLALMAVAAGLRRFMK